MGKTEAEQKHKACLLKSGGVRGRLNGDWWEPHIACLLKALVLLSTLYSHKNAEHNRKQFLEILFLMVTFRLLISDLRPKSVTILILRFLFEERWCWWWSGCASRELKQVLVLRNQTNVSFFVFFSSEVFFLSVSSYTF